MAWIEEQWNIPDRTDHYLMQIALETHNGAFGCGTALQLEQLKIPFIRKMKQPKLTSDDLAPTKENIAKYLQPSEDSKQSQAAWMKAVGGIRKPEAKVVEPPKPIALRGSPLRRKR